MIAILGSGFGLYGYLPALTEGCGRRVVLPEAYRLRFEGRTELSRFAEYVEWKEDKESALHSAEGVVIATRPVDQARWVAQCLRRDNLGVLLLEKPLAISPLIAAELNEELTRSHKTSRIGYTFRFTDWGKLLLEKLTQEVASGHLVIDWSFLAHHYRNDLQNWKRTTATGGGAIRFYGIQLIALLAELGYRNVVSSHSSGKSENELERWSASFIGPALPECAIRVDSRADASRFRVELLRQRGAIIADQRDPFSNPLGDMVEDIDLRIPALTELCRSLWAKERGESVWYRATIALWQEIEAKTRFKIR